MLYRPLGSTGLELSILGFGAMRLPVIDGQQDRIDENAAAEMLHYAIDHGVNYVDTAYPYHGSGGGKPGESEAFIGRALSGGWRDRVNLATKLPSWLITQPGDMDRFLDGQLERLQTDHIDCYLLHALSARSWETLESLGALDFLDKAIADGRISHAGFSFHDDLAVFRRIMDARDWEFAQIQLNYMDTEYQAGSAGLEYAHERGAGVIVMEPLKGGRLARRPPADIEAVWAEAGVERTPAEWALRWVWSQPGVTTLLSGMSTLEQVVANVAAASSPDAGAMTAAEAALVERARDVYRSRIKVGCTACGYCMPCPEGVDIPVNLKQLNNASVYRDVEYVRGFYLQNRERASACTECGQCEQLCPQGLEIRAALREAVELFER